MAWPQKWTEVAANDWYAKQPWLVGGNYIPATAINELEMWQADTFDPERIDVEFGWAESIGMNTMRVFLHDLLWQQDPTILHRTTASPTVQFSPAGGVYTFQLTVTDSTGTSATDLVTVSFQGN